MKKRILSFLLALCMCLTLVPVTVLADDDVQQINDAAVQAITPGSDVSVLSVVPIRALIAPTNSIPVRLCSASRS